MLKHILFIFFGSFILLGLAQTTQVSGSIYDAEFGETIPFVSLRFTGTEIRSMSDIEGKFNIQTDQPVDSLEFTFSGYEKQTIAVKSGTVKKDVRIELSPVVNKLEEVVIERKENPAYAVMRKVIDNKSKNDMASLDAYQYEVYSKVQFDVNNIPEKFKKQPITKKITESIEENITPTIDEDGNEVLTMFISESITDTYFKSNPSLKKDIVKASRVKGVGIEDGSLTSQFVGSSMLVVNLYDNAITIMDKEFVSPITNSWKAYYKYGIRDTVTIDGIECIQMNVNPRRPQDLAFNGTIWIAYSDSSFALKKVDLLINKESNINFIDAIKVRMEWQPTEAGPWLFKTSEYVFDVEDISDRMASMIIRSKSTYQDIVVNQPKERQFYEEQIQLGDNIQNEDENFWKEHRHVQLDSNEVKAFEMVDDIVDLPVVRSYIDILNLFINGYLKFDYVQYGPYIKTYAFNEIEGHRFRFGMKTTPKFSKKVLLRGYVAYGTRDEKFKYGGYATFFPNKSPWTEIRLKSYRDIDLLGVTDQVDEGSLLAIASKWGNQIGAYWNNENKISVFRQVNNSFSQEIGFRHRHINPLFNFSYYSDDNQLEEKSTITTSELLVTARYARNEKFLINDLKRLSLGTGTIPVFTVNYIMGIPDVMHSNFTYYKVDLGISGKIGMGAWGKSKYDIQTGKIFGTLPYPLLSPHLGNQTPFYSKLGFNMMNYFEFVSDQYFSLIYNHHFDGFIMNRIPLAKKAKLRTVVSVHSVIGDVSTDNYSIIPDDPSIQKFASFGGIPYVEIGYGIENIFKIGRVQFFNRLTHLNRPGIQKFGIKAAVQFSL